MALREELDNYNAEIVVGPEDDPQVTNAQLAVEEWNRTTVADGAWLQQNAIGPLSARDIVLANAIDDTNDALSALSAQMSGIDGRSLKSINGRFFSGGSENWQGSDPAIVPDGTGVKNDEVIYVPQNDGVILSMNDDAGHAHQLKIKENEIGYRYLAGTSTAEGQGNIPGAKYKYDTQAGNFRSLVMNATASGNFVVTSAGLQKLECDNQTIGFNDDNQLYVKNYPSVWLVTEDHAINAKPSNTESFLHGGDLHVASAKRSTIGIGQIIADEGTFISDSFIQGSALHVKNDATVTASLIMALGGTVSGDVKYSLLMNNNIVDNVGNVLLGGAGSNRATNVNTSLIWGYGYHNDDKNMLHVGGSCNTSGNDGLAVFGTGGTHAYDNSTSLVMSTGTTASSAQYSLLAKFGGGVSDVKSSVLIDDSGKTITDVHSSVVAGNFKAVYDSTVSDITNSVVVGSGNQLQYGADTSIIAADNLAFDYYDVSPTTIIREPISASILVGNGVCYRSGTTNSLGIGTNLGVKGSNILCVGQDNKSYGDKIFQYGLNNIVNTMDGVSSYAVNLGRNNKQGIGGSIQIGYGNESYCPMNFVIGSDNISEDKNAKVIGDRNDTMCGGGDAGVYIVGNDNKTYIQNTFILGHDNTNLYKENTYSIGYYNESYGENSFMMGSRLRTSSGGECVVLGRYNFSIQDSILEVGYGDPGTNTRKTMFRIDRNGDVWIAGNIHCNDISAHTVTNNTTPPPMYGQDTN